MAVFSVSELEMFLSMRNFSVKTSGVACNICGHLITKNVESHVKNHSRSKTDTIPPAATKVIWTEVETYVRGMTHIDIWAAIRKLQEEVSFLRAHMPTETASGAAQGVETTQTAEPARGAEPARTAEREAGTERGAESTQGAASTRGTAPTPVRGTEPERGTAPTPTPVRGTEQERGTTPTPVRGAGTKRGAEESIFLARKRNLSCLEKAAKEHGIHRLDDRCLHCGQLKHTMSGCSRVPTDGKTMKKIQTCPGCLCSHPWGQRECKIGNNVLRAIAADIWTKNRTWLSMRIDKAFDDETAYWAWLLEKQPKEKECNVFFLVWAFLYEHNGSCFLKDS
ncbi:MAG: uncharacterized protein A8A55_2556 [Amphiamblys sp. WSBS2006]|nr:MAG: uncharacterized protein A8A55_2556 [Amphiamblys sp. WSBS2006]